MKVFTGNANRQLADDILNELKKSDDDPNMSMGNAKVSRFSDGEINVMINENVRGCDVFVIQPTCPPVNENLMELLIMIDALKRASAARITAVIPYFGYARQDRKTESRQPITARLVADLITAAGASRVLTVDLHAGQIQGFFNIPVDNLFADKVLIRYINHALDKNNQNDSPKVNDIDLLDGKQIINKIDNLVIVSPDAGGTKRARRIAQALNAKIAVIDKRRQEANKCEVMNVIGDVKDCICVIVDDIADTAGSIVKAAQALCDIGGAKEVYGCVVHAVLSGPAYEHIRDSGIKKLLVTNTIQIPEDKKAITNKIKQLSVASLLAEAIKRIHKEESVSSLFKFAEND